MYKLLWISDLHTTGYASHAKAIIRALNRHYSRQFKISVLAINHTIEKDEIISQLRRELPFLDNIYSIKTPAKDGLILTYGNFVKDQVLGVYELLEVSKTFQPDYIFALNDNICETYLKTRWAFPNTKYLAYMPVDSTGLPIGFFDSLKRYDALLGVNNIAHQELTYTLNGSYKGVMGALYPVMDFSFHKLIRTEGLRQKWLGEGKESTFIIINVNMNQKRKRLDLTLEAFSKFHQKHPDSHLILKTRNFSPDGIPNLEEALKKDYASIRDSITLIDRVLSVAELNELYNLSNVFLTTSIAEGWGFTPCEAALAGCPVLAPRHTSFIEIFDQFGSCYKASRKSFYNANKTEVADNVMLNYANYTRKTAEFSTFKYVETIPELPLPMIAVSQFGQDVPDQPPASIGNIPVLGNFRTLDYAITQIPKILDSYDRNSLNIMLQTGTDFTFYTSQTVNYRSRPIALHPNFDLSQVKDINTDAFYISNYMPDVDDIVDRLEKHMKSPVDNTDQIVAWFERNCNDKIVADKLANYLIQVKLKSQTLDI